MTLAEAISEQPSIDFITWLLWSLLRQIYKEKEQAKQRKIQNVQFKELKGTRKWKGAKSCAQGNKQMKEKPDGGGVKGVAASVQHPTQLSFHLWRELKQSLLPGGGGTHL